MLPTLDAKQALRLRRFKMAMVSYAMWVALALFAFLTGKMDIGQQVVPVILGGVVLTNLYFYVMIRSGLNKRLTDPSMTVQQLVIAFSWAMVLMLSSDELRGAMMMVYVVTLMFGVFGLRRRGFYLMSAFAIAGYLGVVGAEYAFFPDRVDLSREIITAMVLIASVIWCAWFGSYVAGLKESLRQSNTELREAVSSASRMATRDHLTQSFNRRYMMECLSREKDRADKSGSIFAVCIFDLDHFKALNDRYGHLVGDEVLSAFAYLARQELRATDVIDLDSEGRCFGRFGGEEFMCLLPSTSEAGAIKCAERLRQATEEKVFRGGVQITLSAGVAEYVAGESVADTLRRADEALYFAKQSGRNRVASARPEAPEDKDAAKDVVVKGNFSGRRTSR